MDFEETEWHSDDKTDKLITSLFGTPSSEGNKHKGITKNSTVLNYDTVEGYRKYLLSRQHVDDNDEDAVVSKKQRRRIKEKRRKKNKRSGQSSKEEECDFFDDAISLERHTKEMNFTEDEMSDKLKKKKKQLHVDSSRNCYDDSVQDDSKSKRKNKQFISSSHNCDDDSVRCNSKSKRKTIKHSSVECRFTNFNSSHLSCDDGAKNDSKLKKRKVKKKLAENTGNSTNSSFVSAIIPKQRDSVCEITQTIPNKDTPLEDIQKSSNKKKRKRLCKRNKYKHLIISNTESNPTIVSSDKITDSIADKQQKFTAVEDVGSNKSKLLNRSVEKGREYKEHENSISLSGGKSKKRKHIDNVSNAICRTPNEHEFDTVRTKKHKKSVADKNSTTQDEMLTHIDDKSEKKNMLSRKQKSKEMLGKMSVVKSQTPGKIKLHYNMEKLRAHLGLNKKESDKKVNQKLKSEKLSISKSFETVKVHVDANKSKVDNSSSASCVENVGATKKRKKKDMSLRERMLDRLSSARFRYLSEQMYTQTGSEAKTLFEKDEEAFHVYHEGYQAQVNKWPLSPVHVIIQEIKKKPADLVVADFGCGEAILAQSVPNVVHSFDLVALNEHVTACDMAKVPLSSGSVDIAVFCLSLMGTNLTDYLCEASRVLKKEGLLKIAEVASRFDKPSRFVHGVERMGFRLTNKNTKNKMFYLFDFVKTGNVKKDSIPQIELTPCLYKKR